MGKSKTDRIIPVVRQDILLNIEEKTIILHGCNCFHIMGAGIARYLRTHYPQIYEVDKTTPYGSRKKLGTVSYAVISPELIIGNCYTQFNIYGENGKPPAVYPAISKCLRDAVSKYPDYHFRLPKIGCGLAGGDWDLVEKMYLEELSSVSYTVFEK